MIHLKKRIRNKIKRIRVRIRCVWGKIKRGWAERSLYHAQRMKDKDRQKRYKKIKELAGGVQTRSL